MKIKINALTAFQHEKDQTETNRLNNVGYLRTLLHRLTGEGYDATGIKCSIVVVSIETMLFALLCEGRLVEANVDATGKDPQEYDSNLGIAVLVDDNGAFYWYMLGSLADLGFAVAHYLFVPIINLNDGDYPVRSSFRSYKGR